MPPDARRARTVLATSRAAVVRGARTVAADGPRVVGGVAAEVGWTAAHLLMYPLGLRPALVRADGGGGAPERSAASRGLVRTGVDAALTPILFVHGIVDNHTIFAVLERTLRRRGFQTLSSHDYSLLTRDVRAAAGELGAAVESVVARTGYERIHVVGHSLGGLIARYYVQRRGGDARVHTLVTLGTPHQGTRLASVGPPLPLLRQLRPGSDLMRELARPAPGCRTRFLAVHSDLDHLVVPSGNARLLHPDLDVRQLAVRGVGHMSLTNHRGIAYEIARTLGSLRPDGGPAEGVPADGPLAGAH